MNHATFIDTPATYSASSPIHHPSRSRYHTHRHSSSSTYTPRANLYFDRSTRLAALPPGPLFFDVAYDVADVVPATQLVEPTTQMFAETTTSNIAYATEFSATIDPSAFSAVLFVMLAFGALKFRTDSILWAAKDRKELGKELKMARIRRLTGDDGIGTEGGAYMKVELAYRDALDKENHRRTILPGIEIINPRATVEDMRKESMELLPDLKSRYRGEVDRKETEDLKSSYSRDSEKLVGKRGISVFEVLTLSTLGLSQIALLVLFSHDPMESSIYSSSFMTASGGWY